MAHVAVPTPKEQLCSAAALFLPEHTVNSQQSKPFVPFTPSLSPPACACVVGAAYTIIWSARLRPKPTSELIQSCFLSCTPTFPPLSLLFSGLIPLVLPLLQDKASLFAASTFFPDVPRQPPPFSRSSELFPCAWGWYFSHSAFFQKAEESEMQGSPPMCKERYGLNWSRQFCRASWSSFRIFPWVSDSTWPLAFLQFVLCPPRSSACHSCCFRLGCFLVTLPELVREPS